MSCTTSENTKDIDLHRLSMDLLRVQVTPISQDPFGTGVSIHQIGWLIQELASRRNEVHRLTTERDQAKAQLVAMALALNPVNRKQNDEGATLFELVHQLAAFARHLGFTNATPALWDEADDDAKAQDDLPTLMDNYGEGEGTSIAFGLTGLGSARYTVLPSPEDGPLQFGEEP